MKIEEGDILGGYIGEMLVCNKHLTKEEFRGLTADRILTEQDVSSGSELYFCDRCNKKIAA